MKTAADIDYEISQVCPILGVSIGTFKDKDTWRIDFKDEATDAQRQSAMDVVKNLDVNAESLAPTVDPTVQLESLFGLTVPQLKQILGITT